MTSIQRIMADVFSKYSVLHFRRKCSDVIFQPFHVPLRQNKLCEINIATEVMRKLVNFRL